MWPHEITCVFPQKRKLLRKVFVAFKRHETITPLILFFPPRRVILFICRVSKNKQHRLPLIHTFKSICCISCSVCKVTSRTKPPSWPGQNGAPCQRRASAWKLFKAQPCMKYPSAPSRTGGGGGVQVHRAALPYNKDFG